MYPEPCGPGLDSPPPPPPPWPAPAPPPFEVALIPKPGPLTAAEPRPDALSTLWSTRERPPDQTKINDPVTVAEPLKLTRPSNSSWVVQPMLVHVSSLLVLDAKTSVWPDS